MWKNYGAAFIVSLFAAALLLSPEIGLQAARYGMDIWWKTVFPSLLPFFILTELMAGLGVIAFFGSLSSRMMQVFFRLPGPAGVSWILSLASGFPSGARMAARLRTEGTITRIEAERLVAMAHSSNPLFILSAVASGFLNSPETGSFIAAAHYGGALLVGFSFRFYGRQKGTTKETSAGALHAFQAARKKDGRAFGSMFADAVLSSVQTLMLIGGFILFFSVLTALLTSYGAAGLIFSMLPVQETSLPVFQAMFSGFFELTSGVKQAAASTLSLPVSLILISAILGFSGWSVHAQVAAIISSTDIRYGPFLAARFLHSFYSVVLMLLLLSVPVRVPAYSLSLVPEHGMMVTLFFLAAASALLAFRQSKSRGKKV